MSATDEDVEVLGVELPDGGSIREWFVAAMQALWEEGESFSGKRPFGNSGWDGEIEEAVVAAGLARTGQEAHRKVAHAIGSMAWD